MAYCDMKIAKFLSQYQDGVVELWYCLHDHSYQLRYGVGFRSQNGGYFTVATASYDASDNAQVASLMLDAIDIARTPLLERS
jgi:hypothetical protein